MTERPATPETDSSRNLFFGDPVFRGQPPKSWGEAKAAATAWLEKNWAGLLPSERKIALLSDLSNRYFDVLFDPEAFFPGEQSRKEEVVNALLNDRFGVSTGGPPRYAPEFLRKCDLDVFEGHPPAGYFEAASRIEAVWDGLTPEERGNRFRLVHGDLWTSWSELSQEYLRRKDPSYLLAAGHREEVVDSVVQALFIEPKPPFVYLDCSEKEKKEIPFGRVHHLLYSGGQQLAERDLAGVKSSRGVRKLTERILSKQVGPLLELLVADKDLSDFGKVFGHGLGTSLKTEWIKDIVERSLTLSYWGCRSEWARVRTSEKEGENFWSVVDRQKPSTFVVVLKAFSEYLELKKNLVTSRLPSSPAKARREIVTKMVDRRLLMADYFLDLAIRQINAGVKDWPDLEQEEYRRKTKQLVAAGGGIATGLFGMGVAGQVSPQDRELKRDSEKTEGKSSRFSGDSGVGSGSHRLPQPAAQSEIVSGHVEPVPVQPGAWPKPVIEPSLLAEFQSNAAGKKVEKPAVEVIAAPLKEAGLEPKKVPSPEEIQPSPREAFLEKAVGRWVTESEDFYDNTNQDRITTVDPAKINTASAGEKILPTETGAVGQVEQDLKEELELANRFLEKNFGVRLELNHWDLLNYVEFRYRQFLENPGAISYSAAFDPTAKEIDEICRFMGEAIGDKQGVSLADLQRVNRLSWDKSLEIGGLGFFGRLLREVSQRENCGRGSDPKLHGDSFSVNGEGAMHVLLDTPRKADGRPNQGQMGLYWACLAPVAGSKNEIRMASFHNEGLDSNGKLTYRAKRALLVPANFVVHDTLANFGLGGAILVRDTINIAADVEKHGEKSPFSALLNCFEGNKQQFADEFGLNPAEIDKEKIFRAMIYGTYHFGFRESLLFLPRSGSQFPLETPARNLRGSSWERAFKLALRTAVRPEWQDPNYSGPGRTPDSREEIFNYYFDISPVEIPQVERESEEVLDSQPKLLDLLKQYDQQFILPPEQQDPEKSADLLAEISFIALTDERVWKFLLERSLVDAERLRVGKDDRRSVIDLVEGRGWYQLPELRKFLTEFTGSFDDWFRFFRLASTKAGENESCRLFTQQFPEEIFKLLSYRLPTEMRGRVFPTPFIYFKSSLFLGKLRKGALELRAVFEESKSLSPEAVSNLDQR